MDEKYEKIGFMVVIISVMLVLVIYAQPINYSEEPEIIDSDMIIRQHTDIYPIGLKTTIYNISKNSTVIDLRAENTYYEPINVSYRIVIPYTDNLSHSSFNLIGDNGYFKVYVTDYEFIESKMGSSCCNSIRIQHENELDYRINVMLG